MQVKVLTEYFTDELMALSHPSYSEKMSAYMKYKFPFYGVQAPARKEVVKRIWQTEKRAITQNIRPLALALWKKNEREFQMITLDLLMKCKKEFSINDLSFVEKLITTKSWWDTVDFLAATIIGHILKSDRVLARKTAEKYMSSDNLWLKRTALIFQLKYKESVDEKLLFDMINETIGSKEFFINKASGWALRQYSKFNPTIVGEYIENNRSKLAPLTIREGSKYL